MKYTNYGKGFERNETLEAFFAFSYKRRRLQTTVHIKSSLYFIKNEEVRYEKQFSRHTPGTCIRMVRKNLPPTPDAVTYGSNKQVWWEGTCGHEWQASIKSRSSGENCPVCSGKRVLKGINDLATLKPELASEWSDKNKSLKPTMVSTGSLICPLS